MYTEVDRDKVMEYLSAEMNGGKRLIIVDPYFLRKIEKQEIEDYIKEIERVVMGFQEILIFTHKYYYNGKKEFKELKEKEQQENEEKIINHLSLNRKIEVIKTYKLHDRLWIKDGKDYYIVGSSFNGIGFSFGFIYRLQERKTYIGIKNYLRKKIIDKIKNSKVKRENLLQFFDRILENEEDF